MNLCVKASILPFSWLPGLGNFTSWVVDPNSCLLLPFNFYRLIVICYFWRFVRRNGRERTFFCGLISKRIYSFSNVYWFLVTCSISFLYIKLKSHINNNNRSKTLVGICCSSCRPENHFPFHLQYYIITSVTALGVDIYILYFLYCKYIFFITEILN